MRLAKQLLGEGFAVLATCALLWQLLTLQSSWEAQKLYGNVRLWISSNPELAYNGMVTASQRFPFNPEFRRDMLVPLSRLVEQGKAVDLGVASLAYAESTSALGYDQNILTAWLDYLGRSGYTLSEGYSSALARLQLTNPELPEFFQFGAWQSAAKKDFAGALFAARAMQHKATTTYQSDSAKDLVSRVLAAQ